MLKIGWCDETINPIIGCSKISPGCDNCYAEKMAKRLAGIKKTNYYRNVLDLEEFEPPHWNSCTGWNGETVFIPKALEKVSKWKKPKRIFVGSMGDLFHDTVDTMDLIRIFGRMASLKQHTFMLLTKRPENALKFCREAGLIPSGLPSPACSTPSGEVWPENVWLGVTAENQDMADKRIPTLLQIPASIRFVSVEPMLGPVDLTRILLKKSDKPERNKPDITFNSITGWYGGIDKVKVSKAKLDWVICGGESGSNARPMHPAWAESIMHKCKMAEVPFFFKQWGEWGPRTDLGLAKEDPRCDKWPNVIRMCSCGGDTRTDIGILPMCDCANFDDTFMQKCGKKRAGNELDGKTCEQFPEPVANIDE